MAKANRRRQAGSRTLAQTVTTILSGGLLSFGIALVVLLSAALMISTGKLGEGTAVQVCCAAAALGGLVGGLYAARTLRWRMLPVALGAAFAGALLWVLSCAVGFASVLPLSVGRLLAAALAGGGLAGVLAAR